MPIKNSLVFCFVLVFLVFSAASAKAQHVHGVIDLGVVVEGDVLAVSLMAPLSDVIGFEHAPENSEQKGLVVKAAAMLEDAASMFVPAERARCTLTDSSIETPDYFHDNQAGEHEHEHGHDEEHAEVAAAYTWQCEDVAALDSLGLVFTKGFANVEKIEIQIVTSSGAELLTLEGRVESIEL